MTIVNSYISDIETFKYGKNVNIGTYNRIGHNVVFGNNVTVGHNCIIDDDVIIGDDVVIENFVLLKKETQIGDNTLIDSYVRSSGNNQIGSNVTIRYGVTIAKSVLIEDGAFLSPNVMTIYSRADGVGVPNTVIGRNVFIGTGAVIGPGVTIAEDVIIGAMAYVSKNCIKKGTYVGVPAKIQK